MEKRIRLTFYVGPDGKTAERLESNAPLDLVFACMVSQADKSVPRVDITVESSVPERKKIRHSGVMDPTLRARTECPVLDTLAATDMLSILSDKFLGGK